MKPDNDHGWTRPQVLTAVVLVALAIGITLLPAQDFRIRQVARDPAGKVVIQYDSSSNAAFKLLRGTTVTNITTVVATNQGVAATDQFSVASVGGAQSGAPDPAAFFRIQRELLNAPLTTFTSSPANGESGVAVTRETILRFSNPLSSDTLLTTDGLYATQGGRRLLCRCELSSDRLTATLFYLENLPAASRVRVVFDGNSVRDDLGRLIDADGDGEPGGIAQIDFDTVITTAILGTAMIGRVFRSDLAPGVLAKTNVVEAPLANVQIEVIGAEESMRTFTDSMGNFKLEPCPGGRFFVRIDGRTATNGVRDPQLSWVQRDYYPVVEKAWEAVAGRNDNLASCPPGITNCQGIIYLPLVRRETLQPVSPIQDTVVTFPPNVVAQNPALADVSLIVPANSLYANNGARGGLVGIVPVSPDRPPEPLPPGLTHTLDISVQTDGPQNFDRPVPIRFPNLPDPATGEKLPAGAKTALWSYNHDLGHWEVVGPMTVTDDGKFIDSDPGYGVRQPGWHGTNPGAQGGGSGGCGKGCCDEGAGGGGIDLVCTINQFIRCEQVKVECVYRTLTRGLLGKGCLSGALRCQHDECQPCGGAKKQVSSHVSNSAPPEVGALFQEIESFDEATNPILNEIAAIDASVVGDLPTAEQNQTLIRLNQSLDAVSGGSYTNRILGFLARLSSAVPAQVETAPISGPIFFRASSGGTTVRGMTDASGVFSVYSGLMPFGVLVELFDPATHYVGTTYFPESRMGQRFTFPDYALRPESPHPDSDGDGISDYGEQIIGTDPDRADSDGDGVPDGAEIENGTNPLDGLAVATGIIASADTPGTAVDICAINNIAIIADAEAGVAVFNVLAGLNPLRIAQVDTPGTALAVSCSGNLIAVADGEAGLQIVDISDPPAARIVRQIGVDALGGGSAQAVATAANLAFAGSTGGYVSMVELDTGVLLQSLNLGGRVEDLAIEGTTLYSYADGKLHVLPFSRGPMERSGSVDAPAPSGINTANGRGRLFVGNSIAYVTHTRGYDTFDVSDPTKPALIAAGNTAQFGWKQIVLNGSGLGLATVGAAQAFDVPHNVSLYDTSDPTKTDVFLTQFGTPGIARAVSIYNGLGYVADHKNGMHVVNYLAYDNKKQPPTGELKVSSTNGTITGGGFLILRAEVKDDVQVRNVEFFVDGIRIAVDGNFPFETLYRVPTNALGRQLTFSIGIFDTGGNTSSVTNAPLTVVPDNQPPGITIESPTAGQRFFVLDDVPVRVTAIDNVGIDNVTFQLNGAPVPVRRLSLSEWQLDIRELPTGTNTLTATATDLAGLSSTSKPVQFVVLKEAISREYSIFNFGAPDGGAEAISREISLFNFGAPDGAAEAISREISLFNLGPLDQTDAISREISLFNAGAPDRPQAISRELSIQNEEPPPATAKPQSISASNRSRASAAVLTGATQRSPSENP